MSIILTFSLLLFSCNEEALETEEQQKEDPKIFNGTYTGSFTVHYRTLVKTGSVTLELKDGKYSCSGNTNRIPAGGSGKFSSKNGIITFKDQNFWTADFDGNLILTGPYMYIFDGQNLIISAFRGEAGPYEYFLEKTTTAPNIQ
jgi:hypothetical protein